MFCFSRVRAVAAAVVLAAGMTFLYPQTIPLSADRIVKIAEPVRTICWNQDDSMFALGEADSVIVRDANTLDVLYSFPVIQEMNLSFSRETGSSERFYSDMILGISSKNMAIWDLSKPAEGSCPTPDYPLLFAEGQNAVCAAFSRDSNSIAVAFEDGSIVMYFKYLGKTNGEMQLTSMFSRPKLEKPMLGIQCLAFSPDSKLLAAASSDGSICIWNTVDCSFLGRIYSFSGMQTPVVFSADSGSVYGCIKENVVSRMSLDGTVLNEIRTNRTVRTFTVTPDDKTLIILTGDGIFEYYAVEDGSFLGYIPPYNTSELVSFAFNSDYSQVLTGHEDGSVYKLYAEDVLLEPDEPVPETPDFGTGTGVVVAGQEHSGPAEGSGSNGANAPPGNNSGKAGGTSSAQKSGGAGGSSVPQASYAPQSAPVPFDFQSSLRERFSAFNAGVSALLLDKKSTYYQFGAAVEFDWYTTQFTAPVYEGVGVRVAAAFPADNYPVSYKTLDGSGRIAPPHLFFAEAFVPVGVEVPLGASVNFFSELALALKVSMLMNPGVTSSEPAFSLGGRVRTGITIAKVAVMVGAEYDSMWGIIPEISLIANFKLKGKAGKVKK